jgi:hypothetical protein
MIVPRTLRTASHGQALFVRQGAFKCQKHLSDGPLVPPKHGPQRRRWSESRVDP